MAKLVTKFKYLKPCARQHVGGYAKYIATREGVDKIDESYKLAASTKKQQQLVQKILRDFPDSKEMLEYEDYQKDPTVGNASEFITRALEDNVYEVLKTKTYADYIATRPRAQRFGTHGLFTDAGVEVKLDQVSDELNHYVGNVWTIIISLRREDAERLGYNTGERWRDMLRTQTAALAENFKIPMENLKWYGAFHNESHHPHVHLMVYANDGIKPYLSKQGVMNLRSSFAKDIFAQDLLCVYEKQTEHRNELRVQSREMIADIISKINSGTYDNPKLEEMLLQLGGCLSKAKGKMVYGYLKQDVKAIVNRIVDEIASDERISALYDLWYEQKEETIRTYTQELPQRVPLADNPEFKSVRNAVIEEAMNLAADRMAVDDEELFVKGKGNAQNANSPMQWLEGGAELDDGEDGLMGEPIEPDVPIDTESDIDLAFQEHSGGRGKKAVTWWTDQYKQARQLLYGTKDAPPDFLQALNLMQAEAAKGNGFAMHDLGRMYLSGLGCEKEESKAQEWFAKTYQAFLRKEAGARKKDYLQYRIGKLFSFGYGVEQDYEKAAEWYEKAVAEENPFAAFALGSLHRRGQGVEQDAARAFSLYKQAAEDEKKPNAYAAYELGGMCRDGIGTASDQAASEKWYRQAYEGFLKIERNMADDKLYYRLGQMNLTGTGTEMDLLKAKDYFEKAAKLDNPDALYGLGRLYLREDFPEHDGKQAVVFLIQAAQKGHDYAAYSLGKLFLLGEKVSRNADYALRWLEQSCEAENPSAEYLLGRTLLYGAEDVPQDSETGLELLERAIRHGNLCAACLLGKVYLEGSVLVQDTEKGLSYLTTAANQGFSSAEYLLGRLLYEGKGMARDIPMALRYLASAAEKENPYAACLAGKILITEDTVKDVLRAIRYFETAAEQGNDFAQYQLGRLYLYGKEVERDQDKAISYLTAAAGGGNQYAAQLLASMKDNRNWSAALGAIRLLHHISRVIQNRLEDERKGGAGGIDRKLKRKIDEKKQAHGLRQG